MKKRAIVWLSMVAVCGLVACGTSQKTSSSTEEQTQKTVEPPPECLPRCAFNDEGVCETAANSVDPSGRVTEQMIECDVRCCNDAEPVVKAVDADGDGIPDDVDECVEEPEDFDGYQDEDGCPDPDNDGDNILDADDICPLDAEDVDGFQDEDGCPD